MNIWKVKSKIRSGVNPSLKSIKILMQEMTKYGCVTNRLPHYSIMEQKPESRA